MADELQNQSKMSRDISPLPDPREEWVLPTQHIGKRVLLYDSLDSTNTQAIRAAERTDRHGWVIVADRQSSGRGQYGRVWESPAGRGILLSVLLDVPPELYQPAIMTALAAVSVGEVIQQLTGIQARIKWPNDVLIHGKKVCGILLEAGTRPAGSSPFLVMGIGLNVNHQADEFTLLGLPHATSLNLSTGKTWDTRSVLRTLLETLDTEYHLLTQGEVTTLEACWKWRVGLLGRQVAIEKMDGSLHHGRLREMAFSGIELEVGSGGLVVIAPELIRHIVPMEQTSSIQEGNVPHRS